MSLPTGFPEVIRAENGFVVRFYDPSRDQWSHIVAVTRDDLVAELRRWSEGWIAKVAAS